MRRARNPGPEVQQKQGLKQLDRAYILKGKNIGLLGPGGKFSVDQEDQEWIRLNRGQVQLDQLPSPANTEVRIFLSSTFSDFKVERNQIVQRVLPVMKEFCARFGVDFRVCDMRWGVTDAAVNEHMVERLCLREIDNCRRLSTGPFFVALVGNRYGYQPIPAELDSVEFRLFRHVANEVAPKTAALLDDWYLEDINADPPIFVLLPIRNRISGYGDYSDEGRRRAAGNEWWQAEEGIRNTLRRVVESLSGAETSSSLSPERRLQLMRGVTEAEIVRALYDEVAVGIAGSADRCLVYVREMADLELHLSDDAATRFTDVIVRSGQPILLELAHSQLTRLKFQMRGSCANDSLCLRQFFIPWSEEGLNSSVGEHARYLDDLTASITRDLQAAILKSATGGDRGSDSNRRRFQTEMLHHFHFCREKSSVFWGREEELSTVRRRWLEQKITCPLVLYAESGRGKTALVAKIASLLPVWFGPDVVRVVRFLGTSGLSSTLYHTLLSICQQIGQAYRIKIAARHLQSVTSLQSFFPLLLTNVSLKARVAPLVVLLDSLDQLQHSPGSPNPTFSWLPTHLPPCIHILLSTLPKVSSGPNTVEYLPGLKSRLKGHVQLDMAFLEIPPLSPATVEEIVKSYLNEKKRRLTEAQGDLVSCKLLDSPYPLYLKLTLDEAITWRSYTPLDQCQLANTVREAIELLFSRLETRYGLLLAGYTLGYLTIGLNGLSEVELEDALSCQDEVLNEVYQYHDPPIRGVVRIPALLWSRIQYDLRDYIVERRTDGKLTLCWYHRQFSETATARYVTPDRCARLHSDLATVFSAAAPLRRTCCLANAKRRLDVADADRLISWAPLSERQPRKLRCLAHHMLHSGDAEGLLRHCLANFDYLCCFIKAFGLEECLDWIRTCRETLPTEEIIGAVYDCLTFMQPLLETDPDSFAFQLLGQLKLRPRSASVGQQPSDPKQETGPSPILDQLCQQCEINLQKSNQYSLIPQFACFPSGLDELKFVQEEVEALFTLFWDESTVILSIRRQASSGSKEPAWSVRVFVLDEASPLCTVRVEKRPVVCTLNQVKTMLYVLDSRDVNVYSVESGLNVGEHGVYINNKVMLNKALAVSPDDIWVAIAAEDRIALLTSRHSASDKYLLSHALLIVVPEVNSTVTVQFLYSDALAGNQQMLSCHTRQVNAAKQFIVKCWRFEKRQLIWSTAVTQLPDFYPDIIHLLPLHPVEGGSPQLLIITPDASCYRLEPGLGGCLTQVDTAPALSKLKQVLTATDGITVTRTVERETSIIALDRQGNCVPQMPAWEGEATSSLLTNVGTGRGLALGTSKGLVMMLGDVAGSWQAHNKPVTWLRTRDDGKLYTFSEEEQVVKLWEPHAATNNLKSTRTEYTSVSLAGAVIEAFTLTQAGNELVTVSPGLIMRLWRLSDASLVRCLLPDGAGNPLPDGPVDRAHCFLRDQILVLASTRGLWVFDLTSGRLVTTLGDPVPLFWVPHPSCTDQDLLWILRPTPKETSGRDPGTRYLGLELRRLPSLEPAAPLRRFLPPIGCAEAALRTMVTSPDGNQAMFCWPGGTGEGAGQVWAGSLRDSPATFSLTACASQDDPKRKTRQQNYIGATASQPIYSLLSPISVPSDPTGGSRGGQVLIGGAGEVLQWDVTSGAARIQRVSNFHTWFKHSVTIHVGSPQPEGRNKPTGSGNKMTALTERSNQLTKMPITALICSEGPGSSADVVVSGCAGGHVIVWFWRRVMGLAGKEPLSEVTYRSLARRVHADKVTCLALSPDVSLVVSGGADKRIALINAEVGTVLLRAFVHAVPRELTLINTEQDQELRLVGRASYLGQLRLLMFRVVGNSSMVETISETPVNPDG